MPMQFQPLRPGFKTRSSMRRSRQRRRTPAYGIRGDGIIAIVPGLRSAWSAGGIIGGGVIDTAATAPLAPGRHIVDLSLSGSPISTCMQNRADEAAACFGQGEPTRLDHMAHEKKGSQGEAVGQIGRICHKVCLVRHEESRKA
jgi:hypothetical protein